MRALACCFGLFLSAGLAQAVSPAIPAPDGASPIAVDFGGKTFVNHGLVGAGRLAASLHDFHGDSLGSVSGLALGPGWRRKADGSFSGALISLPDRGFNAGKVYSDFAARYETLAVTFAPRDSAEPLPLSPDSQDQLRLTPKGGLIFRDFRGQPSTGANPGTGTKTEHGVVLPSPAAGALGAGRISLDNEAIAFLKDGSFYVGDEYGANVYYFDAKGRMKGVIVPPRSARPRDARGNLVFGVDPDTGADLAVTGRRANQGFEGVSVTPDGRHLIAVMQSALLQDSAGKAINRNNTRVYVYDIATSRTPKTPAGEYVLQLPVYAKNGDGKLDATAAQSEVLALDAHQFLVLPRDGAGLGKEDGKALVFKAVWLADTDGATNIAGTAYDTSDKPVVTGYGPLGGALDPAIVPVKTAELINLIDPAQLARAGLSTAVTPLNPTVPTARLSEKWEGMALAPVLDKAAPDDYFLFVGNDNDFLTPTGCAMPGAGDCNSKVENDTVVMVWRVTLPGYGREK